MASYNDASARAHSRAAVYQAIEDAYGGKKYDQKSSTIETPSVSQNVVTSNAVNVILDIINDSSQKSRQFITEVINGKQIVVENIKTARDLKSSNKAKSKSKRRSVISNKLLKKKGLCKPTFRPCNGDISLMHNMWWSYIKSVIKSCQSEVQLQARLYASEMVGARCIVLDAVNEKLEGIKGIITSVSGSCYYIVIDTLPGSGTTVGVFDPSQPHNENRPRLGHVLRLVKEQCNLGIVLPAISRAAVAVTSTENNGGAGADVKGIPTKTPVKSTNSDLNVDTTSDSDNEDKHNNDEDNGSSDEVSVHSDTEVVSSGFENANVEYSHKVFDWNEKSEGSKLCVLYGKSFMPHCLFDDKQ